MGKPLHYIDVALKFAIRAHSGQTDKAGQPYILHPMRLAAQCDRLDQKTASLLHDVLEDSDITAAELLAAGIPPHIVNAVELLTFLGDKTDFLYFQYIRKIRKNMLAQAVKRLDLLDNLDPARLVKLKDLNSVRVARYHRAFRILMFMED